MELAELPDDLGRLVGRGRAECHAGAQPQRWPGHVLRPQAGLVVGPAGPGPRWWRCGTPTAVAGPRADSWAVSTAHSLNVAWRASVAAGAALAAPFVLVHWLEGEGAAVFPRFEVEVGPNASAQVLEVVSSPPADLLAVPLTQLVLAPGARLGFGHVQLLGARAWQLGNQVSRVSRDATLRSMTVALGGRVRTSAYGLCTGGAVVATASCWPPTSASVTRCTTCAPSSTTPLPEAAANLLFKGAVANSAHSVYSGLIRVEKGAKGTNAFQTNRNLVLSEGAQADSVPNLEIEDNDVRCSHASAVGPIDESQLFYLESRGVPTRAARTSDRPRLHGRRNGAFPAAGLAAMAPPRAGGKLDAGRPRRRSPMSEEIRVKLSDLPKGCRLGSREGLTAYASLESARTVYALADRCSHQNWTLSDGEVEPFECTIECTKHGSTFSLKDGYPQCLPATQPVAVYPTRVEGDEVVVTVP